MVSLPSKRFSGPLTERELEYSFKQLVGKSWRYEDARPFAKRVKLNPATAAPYLVEQLSSGEREREVASALLLLLKGPRVIAPLYTVLRDTGKSDAVRAAAASILSALGEPIVTTGAACVLRDPGDLATHALQVILQKTTDDEAFREQFLDNLDSDDEESRADVIESLAESNDDRALHLLLPLIHSSRPSTVSRVVWALERLGNGAALAPLKELAEHGPRGRIRQEARAAYGRIMMRASTAHTPGYHRPGATAGFPVYRACATLLDQHGDQAIIVARMRPADGFLKTLTIHTSDTAGIKECYGVDMMRPEELDDMLASLNRQGITPVEIGLAGCRDAADEARQTSLRLGKRLPMPLAIWRDLLEGDDAPPAPQQIPLWRYEEEDLLNLISKTGGLLAAPEFRQWFFDVRLVWPYVDEWSAASIEERSGEQGKATLEELTNLAILDVLQPEMRRRLWRRLTRQSDLLATLGKGDLAKLAAAAARGLDAERGIPAEHHPFVRAMTLGSFMNAGLRMEIP
jgi:hypothetical protein